MRSRGNLHLKHCTELEILCQRNQALLCHLSTAHTTAAFHTTPPETEYIGQRKWEYFHFCSFKVSTFAHD